MTVFFDKAALVGRRSIERVVGELRRGTPIVLSGTRPGLVLACETAAAAGIAEFASLVKQETSLTLVLSGMRSARLLDVRDGVVRPITAFAWSELGDAALLHALANPLQDAATHGRGSLKPCDPPPLAEEALALCKLAQLLPAVLLADIDARASLEELGLLLAADPAAVRAYPAAAAAALTEVASATVPLAKAHDVRIVAFRPGDGGNEHLAVVVGDPSRHQGAPLVRVHSECFTGDVLGSLRCDCGEQLQRALARMQDEGAGILIYLAQEGRGIGLVNKLRAYVLQDLGLDTLDANRALGFAGDERGFAAAATMLRALEVGAIRLLTNNPDKVVALRAAGIEVANRVPHAVAANGVNDAYLATKATRFGHML